MHDEVSALLSLLIQGAGQAHLQRSGLRSDNPIPQKVEDTRVSNQRFWLVSAFSGLKHGGRFFWMFISIDVWFIIYICTSPIYVLMLPFL